MHRDVKPSNIMINNDGRIKIGDFGIAHTESSELTQHGDVLGTPHYMAPEQFLGLQIGVPADLYAVGIIAYDLLTGTKPFVGTTVTVMQQVLNQRPADPSSLNPKLSALMDRAATGAGEEAKSVSRARPSSRRRSGWRSSTWERRRRAAVAAPSAGRSMPRLIEAVPRQPAAMPRGARKHRRWCGQPTRA